jgi:SAM-dependent methyltransferase
MVRLLIRILQDWAEIGRATIELQRQGLLTHPVVQKNWDFWQILEFKSFKNKRVVDLGCGGLYLLNFLYSMQFNNLAGIDLSLSLSDRIYPLFYSLYTKRTLRPAYRLHRGTVEKTGFNNNSFDFAISLSVIEHGVDLHKFFSETARILTDGAIMYLSTDYWEPKIHTDESMQMYGAEWTIFSKDEINNLIDVAQKCGFCLRKEVEIPKVKDPVIYNLSNGYTFCSIEMELKKKAVIAKVPHKQ